MFVAVETLFSKYVFADKKLIFFCNLDFLFYNKLFFKYSTSIIKTTTCALRMDNVCLILNDVTHGSSQKIYTVLILNVLLRSEQ